MAREGPRAQTHPCCQLRAGQAYPNTVMFAGGAHVHVVLPVSDVVPGWVGPRESN